MTLRGVNIDVAYQLMKLYALTGKPVLLRANHGIGKSAIVYDFAREINRKVVERRLSQMSEGDLTGIPSKTIYTFDGKTYEVTEFAPPKFILEAVLEPCILFLDEIDRAILELRQAAFQIMDSKAFNGIKLHPDTIVIAAINGGPNSNDSYQVSNMDPAELSRYSVIDIILDVPIWLKWAKKNNLHTSILNYIREDNSKLAHSGVFITDVVYPCPRSWHRLSDVLYRFEEDGINQNLIKNIAESFIGYDIAPAFCKFYIKEYKIFNICKLADGEYKGTKLRPNEKAALCSLEHITTNVFSLVNKTSDKNIENLIEFVQSLDSEMLILFISNMFFASSELMNNMNYTDFSLIKILQHNSFKEFINFKLKY